MSRTFILNIDKQNPQSNFDHFFADLIKKGVVDAIMIPQKTELGKMVSVALIKAPEKVKGVDPFSMVLPVNAGTLAGNISFKDTKDKIAVVLKPCEFRTLIELVKLLQARLEKLVTIVVDCPGVYSVSKFKELLAENPSGLPAFKGEFYLLDKALQNQDFRKSCQICEYPNIENANISMRFFETAKNGEIYLTCQDEIAKEISEKLGLEEKILPQEWNNSVEEIKKARQKKREEEFKEIRAKIHDLASFLDQFSTCIRCYNCREACPMCYCKECTFKTPTFAYEPEQYMHWAERKGEIKMPVDTLLFHLTRMNHMITSCVACGMCEEACPNDLPVSTLFQAIGEKVQKIFDYVPGRSIADELPLATFKEEELSPR